MGYATIQGRNIHYLYPQEAEAGVKKGHTVLFVHGAYDNHGVWSSQYRYLEREHTPISLDLPGHGKSEGPPINNTKGFREFIKAFADVMGLAPFVFAGHSMGGSMALDYALHYPEMLEGIVAVGAAPRWDTSPELVKMWKENPAEARNRNTGYLFSQKTPGHIIERYDKQLRASSVEA
ncbi:MAG: alpha/beta fold hydrolase, partial [Dehalococcoidia bacterium]